MNYFELFEQPLGFIIDKAQLSKKYFLLQKKFHPDFYSNVSEEEQAEVLETSAQVNKGYKILQDEDSTIRYLLMLKGLLEEEEKYVLPPKFLMEMMELNESISEDSKDTTSQKILIDKEVDLLYGQIKPLFTGYSDGHTPEADLLKIKEYYFKKKYLKRILDRLEGISNIASLK